MTANLQAPCTHKQHSPHAPCPPSTRRTKCYQQRRPCGEREKGSFPASLRVVRRLDVSMASTDTRGCTSSPVPDVPPSPTVLLLPAALGASQRRFASGALGRPLQSRWRVR
ncbi:hypothetical protein P4O66_017254 [Electrophorus voltai]|uniref:Uncharacterized protein n=1 Tax=Electrophorus voltai TaxID=2609070 RepID=A0AAD8YTA2_9TELE|nr:hypothetical protein P4O66_017254 [Electrophorus voltai]